MLQIALVNLSVSSGVKEFLKVSTQTAARSSDQAAVLKNSRRRPTLPHSYPCSTIGPERLNFRVRDGNGCDPLGIATEKLFASLGSITYLGNCIDVFDL